MSDIKLTDIYKSFGEKKVLSGFTHCFSAGSRSCIMGASGAGKTTLLNIILGLFPPDKGEIIGVPRKISAVFQEDRLIEDITAVDNLRLVAGKAKEKEELAELLRRVGLYGSEFIPVSELSGGMKRRVAIARALCAQYDLLILDEPFKGLDDDTKGRVIEVINDLTAGKTLIAVTHDIAEAKALGAVIIDI